MNLLLSERIPLRTSRALGDFAEDFVLPHRLGDLSAAPFKCYRLDNGRANGKFFAADHPMPVLQVFVDRVKVFGWETGAESDADGHTWQVINFAEVVPPGAEVAATGTGVLNPVNGSLIENPADLMAYVMRVAGRSEIFPLLRSEAAAAGIRLAGSIGAGMTSPPIIRDVLDAIAESAGAIWTIAGARLYPAPVSGLVLDVTPMASGGIEVDETIVDTCDILRVTFDESDALGGTLQYVELTASPLRFGGVFGERSFPMIRDPATAALVGRAALRRMAAIRRDIELDIERTDIRPGTWLRPDLPEWPTPDPDPNMMVLTVDVAKGTNTTRATGEAIMSEPLIRVTGRTVKVPTPGTAGVEVSVRDGIATLRIVDADRQPIKDARLSLDGGPAKTTDANGVVSFSIPVGAEPVDHELAIEAPGKKPITITVRL